METFKKNYPLNIKKAPHTLQRLQGYKRTYLVDTYETFHKWKRSKKLPVEHKKSATYTAAP
ncbi:MAG: hypothetical protein LBJ13_01630, partial [Puniceicoccales bacterium]|nr:hypothetical protein [Puniceicoccales bacterium]